MIDLTGQRFGLLRAIERVHYPRHDAYTGARWFCICDCGGATVSTGWGLRRGRAKSCGCTRGKTTRLPAGVASFNALLRHYKYSAEKRGIEFSLSAEAFRVLTSSNCAYCGAAPSQLHIEGDNFHGRYVCNGIDRVDNEQGYVEGNCVSCCARCNYMKRAMSREQFLSHVRQISEFNR
jgi:hypothetical protein